MTSFVLVHGAWSGPHTFRLIRRPLLSAGHDVFTPGLTGLGERSHLLSPQIRLRTHVEDVTNAILYEDLTDIVLLGFSYGGMVVTGALEHIGDRVAHLVYLDAFVPDDGESLDDLTGRGPRPGGIGAPWADPPMARTFADPAEAARAQLRVGPQPIGCFSDPVVLPQPLEQFPFSRTYIKATGEPRPAGNASFWRTADRVRDSPAWRYREIATDHLIPINRPEELTACLLELA